MVEQYPEEGCGGCSMYADQISHLAHLRARDTNFVAVSRAPQEHIQRFKARMGWEFPWYTTTDDFSEDFGVGEWHGTNVCLRDGDRIFRTYFVSSRGDEAMGTPYGRQEEWEVRRTATRRPLPTSGGTTTIATRARRDRPSLLRAPPEAPRLIGGHTLRMERTFAAPAQRVFDAFTSEQVMRRWWHASTDWETPVASTSRSTRRAGSCSPGLGRTTATS